MINKCLIGLKLAYLYYTKKPIKLVKYMLTLLTILTQEIIIIVEELAEAN